MGMDDRVHNAGGRRQLVCLQGEPRNDTEGPSATTFQRPEQVGIERCVGDPHRTVGSHDFGFEEAGGRRPVQPRITPEPSAEDETGNANRQAPAALNEAGASRGHGVIDMAPDGPRPTVTAESGAAFVPTGTNASRSSIPAMRRVQISSESR